MRYLHSMADILGAETTYSYDVVLHPHVNSLDGNPHVSGVACADAGSMSVSLSDVRAAEGWLAGQILAGGREVFDCREERDGPALPFARIIQRVAGINVGVGNAAVVFTHPADVPWEDLPAATPGRIRFETSLAGPEHCFESISMEYSRVPSPHEAELRRVLRANATMLAELRRLQWGWLGSAASAISNTVSSVSSAVSSAVNTASNAVSSVSSTVSRTYSAVQSTVSSAVQTGE